MKYGLKFINERKLFKECLSLKLKKKKEKEKKIFSKQFVTTELTKYGLKFSVLSIIINERNKRKKNVIMKKKRKYLVNNNNEIWFKKENFQWMSFVSVEKI